MMSAFKTSRRSLFEAIASIPIVAAVGATPGAAEASDRSDWDDALATLNSAREQHEAACSALSVAETAYFAKRPARPAGGIVLFAAGRSFTMDEAMANARAEEKAWKDADRQCEIECDIDTARTGEADACDAFYDALVAVIRTPAPDLAAVVHKIELARDYGQDIHDLDPALADIRRLAGKDGQ